ncbi:MAG: hypothetical protein R2838_09315 [Caldilineaceae bacterium]
MDGYPAGIDTQIEEVADTLQAHGGFALAPRVWVKRSVSRSGRRGRKSAAGRFGCRPATT